MPPGLFAVALAELDQRLTEDDLADWALVHRYRIPLDELTLHNVENIDRPPGAGIHRRTASTVPPHEPASVPSR